jgi:hypothetical protein
MGSKITSCTPKPKVFNVQWKGKKNRKKWVKIASPRRARMMSKFPSPTCTPTTRLQPAQPILNDMVKQYTYDVDHGTSTFESFTLPKTMASGI